MNIATETISVVQYLMRKDENDACWRKIRMTDCRVAALAYGQANYIEADRVAYMAMSDDDRARARAMLHPLAT